MKYVITDEVHPTDPTLFRIEAKIDIPNFSRYGQRVIREGQRGGYVRSEHNLAHSGNAWIDGGIVQDHARVDGNAWVCGGRVSGKARIYGNARVYGGRISGDARVYDNAVVSEDAQVFDSAQVFGKAQISRSAKIYDSARASGCAEIMGNATVFGDAHIRDARVYGRAMVYDQASISGPATFCQRAQVHGNAKVSGDVYIGGDARVCGRAEIFHLASLALATTLYLPGQYLCVGPLGEHSEFVTITHDGFAFTNYARFAGTPRELYEHAFLTFGDSATTTRYQLLTAVLPEMWPFPTA